MMDFGSWWWFPFAATAGAFALIIGLLLFIFWIWMIIDAAKRNFRQTWEKVVWIVIIVFGSWIGALVYLLVVRMNNPKGLAK